MHHHTKLHDPRLHGYWDLNSDIELNLFTGAWNVGQSGMLSVSQRCIPMQSFMTLHRPVPDIGVWMRTVTDADAYADVKGSRIVPHNFIEAN